MTDEFPAPPTRFNIADYFLDARIRQHQGARTALIVGDRKITYARVHQQADRFAHLLVRAGARAEERILIALPDGEEFVAAFFGCLKIGAVAVMVNPQSSLEEARNLLDYSKARVLVVGDSGSHFLSATTRDSELVAVLSTQALDPEELDEIPSFVFGSSQSKTSIEPEEPFATVATHRDDPAIWLFSGGTTGRPKAVVQSHRSFFNTTELYAKRAMRYSETDITLAVPKLYFGYATGSGLLFPFAVGATTILFPEHPTPDALFDLIARHRPTILVNVPTMIQKMLAHPEAKTADLSSLRCVTSAGEALPIPLYRRWKEHFGVELLDGLGTAEMWHIFITNTPDNVRPGTLGRVVPGFEVSIRDRHGKDLDDGQVGRLWVKGNSRANCYWQDMEKSHSTFRGEWVVGGDMICRDQDGYITYCGRRDDALKVGGKWLLPAELESCLAAHSSVRECAVVGLDIDGLTKPVAFVTVAEPSDHDHTEIEELLKQWALDHLQPYKHPRRVVVLDEFPRTHLGKIARGKLKSLLDPPTRQ